MPVRSIEYDSAAITVTVGTTLTLRDLALIRDALARGPQRSQIVIDFRDAASVEVAILEALARTLSDSGTSGRFVGLTFTNERLLAYLGSDASSKAPLDGRSGKES